MGHNREEILVSSTSNCYVPEMTNQICHNNDPQFAKCHRGFLVGSTWLKFCNVGTLWRIESLWLEFTWRKISIYFVELFMEKSWFGLTIHEFWKIWREYSQFPLLNRFYWCVNKSFWANYSWIFGSVPLTIANNLIRYIWCYYSFWILNRVQY